MTCFHPLQVFKHLRLKTALGKTLIFWHPPKSDFHLYEEMQLPCGQCSGCRLERSRQWAIRCVHESRLYDHNCFITLTFNDDFLMSRPNPWTVDVRDYQLFMKRLRKKFSGLSPVCVDDKIIYPIRFFHCGEYGELFMRPHYHACLFNFDFRDKIHYKTVNGYPLYTSKSLEELWPYGFSTIGSLTFHSAAYTARYIMKKVTGSASYDHYNKVDPVTGEVLTRNPEYVTMSRRSGIGKSWIDKYLSDVYVNGEDSVLMNGKRIRPPKYYDSQFEILFPSDLESIKSERKRKASLHEANCTPERLRVREKIQLASLRKLPRIVE